MIINIIFILIIIIEQYNNTWIIFKLGIIFVGLEMSDC